MVLGAYVLTLTVTIVGSTVSENGPTEVMLGASVHGIPLFFLHDSEAMIGDHGKRTMCRLQHGFRFMTDDFGWKPCAFNMVS